MTQPDTIHIAKQRERGGLTLLETVITLCLEIKVSLIAICLNLVQILIQQKGFSFLYIGWH